MTAIISSLGLFLSFSPHPTSAMARCPFYQIQSLLPTTPKMLFLPAMNMNKNIPTPCPIQIPVQPLSKHDISPVGDRIPSFPGLYLSHQHLFCLDKTKLKLVTIFGIQSWNKLGSQCPQEKLRRSSRSAGQYVQL